MEKAVLLDYNLVDFIEDYGHVQELVNWLPEHGHDEYRRDNHIIKTFIEDVNYHNNFNQWVELYKKESNHNKDEVKVKVRVYFETSSSSDLVATFTDENLYMACLPALEAQAKKDRMFVTESIDS
jgi:hypothetical protein